MTAPTPSKPRQARSRLSTRALLDAAADVIAEVGYERATLAVIGKRAGYSHGLVTRRFGSKENLVAALVERMTVTWAEQEGLGQTTPDRSAGGAAAARAVAGVEAVRASIERSPREVRALYALMFEGLKPVPALRERVAALHRRFRSSIEQRIRHEIEVGSLPDSVDPAMIARVQVSGLRGAAYQWLLDPDDFDIDAALRDLRRVLLLLLTADGKAPQ